MIKKFMILTVLAVAIFSSPAFALFTNGGFETGDFSGWTLDFGQRPTGSTNFFWHQLDHGLRDVIDDTAIMPNQDIDINPYNGTYMARINDVYGNYHATKIFQTDTISQVDIDNGSTLYVNWGAVLTEPTNGVNHDNGNQPFFGITVTVDGIPQQIFTADATAHATDPTWNIAGHISDTAGISWDSAGDLRYKSGTWSFDLSSYSIGTGVTIEMVVADCGLGGHGGYAFLDGIGTTYLPPNTVPAPGALLLGGLGTVLVGWMRRRRMA